jgi:hypothetical protein
VELVAVGQVLYLAQMQAMELQILAQAAVAVQELLGAVAFLLVLVAQGLLLSVI